MAHFMHHQGSFSVSGTYSSGMIIPSTRTSNSHTHPLIRYHHTSTYSSLHLRDRLFLTYSRHTPSLHSFSAPLRPLHAPFIILTLFHGSPPGAETSKPLTQLNYFRNLCHTRHDVTTSFRRLCSRYTTQISTLL